MEMSSTQEIPGRPIKENLGIVYGSTVRAKHVGRDIMAGFKHLVGGELKGYTELLEEARKQAIGRMENEAKKLGANGLVGVRLETCQVAQGAVEILAYGTAVKLD